MATYPNALPVFPVHSARNEYPKVADRNTPNREIEAIATELGTNPRSISDSVAPGATPASVAAYLDMLANIFKSMTGAANWNSAAVPIRRMIGGGASTGVVSAGATTYLGLNFHSFQSTENLAYVIMPYDGTITKLYVVTLTSQPASGSMVFTWRVNQSDSGTITLTVPASGAAATRNASGLVTFYKGDRVGIKTVNNASANSAQVAGCMAEVNQKG